MTMQDYFALLASQLGTNIWAIFLVFAWSLAWKMTAFWKSARKGHLVWFIIFGFVQTFGLLEILYIFGFSKMSIKRKKEVSKVPIKRKKVSKTKKRK